MIERNAKKILTIYKGNTYSWSCTLTDDKGRAYVFTTETVEFAIKKNKNDSVAILEKTATIDGPGKFTIDLTAANTTITPGTYWYEIKLYKATTLIKTLQLDNIDVKEVLI